MASAQGAGQLPVDLPSSKQINHPAPGAPQRVGSLTVSLAASPDGKYVVSVNGGFGSFESGYMQSLAVMEVATGKLTEYPEPRTLLETHQILFSGLAFSADGKHVYASLASASDPEGTKPGDTGSGVAVYSFQDGALKPERVMKIPIQTLAAGRRTRLGGGEAGAPEGGSTAGLPYPAAIAVLPDGNLLVADNLSDDVLLMEANSGVVLKRFDLAESDVVPSVYPVALAVAKDGQRAFVALWNASEVVELNLAAGTVGRKLPIFKPAGSTSAGSHPTSLLLSPDGRALYVALGNRDSVASLDVAGKAFAINGYFDARLPGQSFYGAQPEALALNADGSRLYVADMGTDAIAVIDPRKLTKAKASKGMIEPEGFIPTEWLPMGVAVAGGKLFIAAGKSTGTGPNNFAQRVTDLTRNQTRNKRDFTYIATLLRGSVASVEESAIAKDLPAMTQTTLEDNRLKAANEKIAWAPAVANGGKGPIKHVIYIIKENRTYDQVFGDLTFNGQPVGNGDKRLTMYGNDITPNQHKLVLQFGVLDNFYDSAEVSGDGHVWSNAAIGSDYLERTWQLNYRGREHGYDFEGVVSSGLPLEQHIPDVNEPGSGYLWGNVARHGMSLMHFGEFISSTFCNEKGRSGAVADPREGPMREGKACTERSVVKPGEKLPDVWGGGINKWPWPIPLLAVNSPTKPELVGHFAPEYPDFNLRVPDQVRVDIFEQHLKGWLADKQAGKDTMPNFVMLRLGNDHTAGTAPGGPTPMSSVADNDLAVGRAVDLISHSAFWNDTAFFIIEDDAQGAADHVDAHRSLGIVVSKYAPKRDQPFVDSRFYSTVSMVRTMETVLGLPPMNNNDALSSMMGSLFTGAGDQPAFTADARNRDNGLIYTANKGTARGGEESAKMDFRHADQADARKLNVILWQDAKGDTPVPAMLTQGAGKGRKTKKDADD